MIGFFLCYLACFFAGTLFANCIPHITHGVSGRRFPTPFATPPGEGESNAVTNVLWGALNLSGGYAFLVFAGSLRPLTYAVYVSGVGGLLMALYLAWHFGRIYGRQPADGKPLP